MDSRHTYVTPWRLPVTRPAGGSSSMAASTDCGRGRRGSSTFDLLEADPPVVAE